MIRTAQSSQAQSIEVPSAKGERPIFRRDARAAKQIAASVGQSRAGDSEERWACTLFRSRRVTTTSASGAMREGETNGARRLSLLGATVAHGAR
jgi:hypothetical protein